MPGAFQCLAPPPSAKKRLFDDNGDKADDEQGKNNAQHHAHACTDTEEMFICHRSPRLLCALQRLVSRPLCRGDTVIKPDTAIGIAGQDQPRMRLEQL